MNINSILKWFFSVLGGIMTIIEPNIPFIIIAFAFIIADCISSYRLARRVKRTTGKSNAKFQSKKAWKVVLTALAAMATIVLAWVIQKYILVMYDNLYLPNWTAAFICGIQAWSILENEASCNGSKWAILAQKIVIDKTERHFDVDLSILKNEVSEEEKEVVK